MRLRPVAESEQIDQLRMSLLYAECSGGCWLLVAGCWSLVLGCWWPLPYGRGSERGAGRVSMHVEKHIFDVPGLPEPYQALGEGFDLSFWKNEPILS